VDVIETPGLHFSPRFTKSCMAACESPTIELPAILTRLLCRSLARAIAWSRTPLRRFWYAGEQDFGEAVHVREQRLLCPADPE
jgi:hypothetical protein